MKTNFYFFQAEIIQNAEDFSAIELNNYGCLFSYGRIQSKEWDKKLISKSTYPLPSNPIKNKNSIQAAESTESTCAENHQKQSSKKQNEFVDTRTDEQQKGEVQRGAAHNEDRLEGVSHSSNHPQNASQPSQSSVDSDEKKEDNSSDSKMPHNSKQSSPQATFNIFNTFHQNNNTNFQSNTQSNTTANIE